MKKVIYAVFVLMVLTSGLKAQITVNGSNGANGNYTSLTSLSGAFTSINASDQSGRNIVITITGNSLAETGSVSLTSGLWTSLTLYPVAPGLTISGSSPNQLIALNGSKNVTIDGSLNASGSSADLTIINTNTGASSSAIFFLNSASDNVIKHCNIKGSQTGIKAGIINFGLSASGSGNDTNIIENNNISGNGTARPWNALYSFGTTGRVNDANIIRNNNFFDFFNPGAASTGIMISSYSSGWTISGNSFYETTPLVPTASLQFTFIKIFNPLGGNFTVSDNFFGGTAPLCGGSALAKTNALNNAFIGISLNVGNSTVSNLQNNKISKINWSNSANANWTGIEITGGNVNIGTSAGNIIGSQTGTGSIVVSSATSGSYTYGIKVSGTGIVNCSDNYIGSIITTNTSSNSSNIIGIIYSGASGSIINHNTIGSETTANNIFASSSSTGSPQFVTGISNSGSGTITFSNNTLANLTNGSINSSPIDQGQITGITSTNGSNIISDNVIYNLTIANANTGIRLNASVIGISLSVSPNIKTVTGNTIYNLSNTNSSFLGGIIGLHFEGGTTGNIVSRNFIHSLSVASTSNGANIFGIRIASGSTTFSNNIVNLGGDTPTTIYGIFESGATNTTNNLYFNTIYIGGAPRIGNFQSFALQNNSTSNTRNFRNNIFANVRSNNGATGKHYAIRLLGISNLTIDNNDYYSPGTGGTLGYLTTDRPTLILWQSATGQDANSRVDNPVFASPGSTVATGYKIGVSLPGALGTGILIDFSFKSRGIPPSIGAWERPANSWKGSLNNPLWSIPSNWTDSKVPSPDSSIYFDDAPISNCQLDGAKSVRDINNATAYLLVTNGFNLTVKGNLNFSNGAHIDASSTGSTIEFAGSLAQSIPAGAFLNNKVYNLTINNANNVILNDTLNLLNTITATSGVLDASAMSPAIIYGGSLPQTIATGVFLNDKLYDLTIDNSAGVSLNSAFGIDNTLTVNSSKIFTVNPSGRATVSALINNGTLNLNSTSSSDIFSLIMDSYSGTGSSNVQLFLSGGGAPAYNWHYVAVPVNGLSTSYFTSINSFNLLTYNDSRVVSSDFNGWSWHDGYGGTAGIPAGGGFTTMEYGKGYNFYHTADATVNFTAMPSLGTSFGTIPLQYTGSTPGSTIYGYNLLGNSLTCSLDWDKVLFDGPVNSAVYYTTGNKWATYIPIAGGTNQGTKDIPPLQGFFVKASGAGASIDLSGAREHSAQPRYKKSSEGKATAETNSVYPKVKLELKGTATSDETIVWFNDEATEGFDQRYDAYKMFASEASFSQLYSSLGNVNYAINGMPMPVDSSIVPLGIKIANSGNYSLLKKNLVAPAGYDILLIDKANNNFTVNLKNTDEYAFTSEAGTFANRFIIKTSNLTTGIEDPVTQNGYFNIYAFNGMVNIIPMNSSLSSTKGEVKIFDITGRIIKHLQNVSWQEGSLIQIPCNQQEGIYMVEAVSGAVRYVGKVYLH